MTPAIHHFSRLKIAIVLTLAIFLLLADRALKTLARLLGPDHSVYITPGLNFNYQANPHIAFSLPLSGDWLVWFLSLVSFTVLLLAIINFRQKQPLIGLLLTIIGICAITNILDRYLYGAVIDYLELFSISVINLADVLISICSCSLLLILLNPKKVII